MNQQIPDFEQVLQALLDESKPFPPQYLYYLGDLEPKQVAQVREIWGQVPLQRRRALMKDLETITDNDLTASFKDIGIIALADPDAAVRFGAIRLLWVEDDYALIPRFLEIARNDHDIDVRANAVGALGSFMYFAALEELPWRYTNDIETTLMGFLQNEAEADIVRRQALEVLGYSLNLDIDPWIEEAFASPDEAWQSSALFAAGRTAHARWGEKALAYLHHTSPRLRADAARAAGEMMLTAATGDLIELLEDVEAEVRMTAAWALSEIGGEGVAEALEGALENAADEEEETAYEEALANLAVTDQIEEMMLMDLDPEDLDEMIREMDMDEFLEVFGDGEDEEEA